MFFLLTPEWNVYKTSYKELPIENWCTLFEWEYCDTPEWMKKIEEEAINIKIARLREINAELLEWWWANALVWFERIDDIRTAKVSELNREALAIKTDLENEDNYDQTLVDSLLFSFFG